MSYYKDLSFYNYTHHSIHEFNVGWLEKDQPYTVGEAPEGFLDKLKIYSERSYRIHQTRGWHNCPFCEDKTASGSCELRIIGADKKVYACPELIIHYIEIHNYLPPLEFIEAVLNGIHPGVEEYKKIIEQDLFKFWERRKPDTSDEDHEQKMIEIMSDDIAKSIDAKIIEDLKKDNPEFGKLMDFYKNVSPEIFKITNPNKSE